MRKLGSLSAPRLCGDIRPSAPLTRAARLWTRKTPQVSRGISLAKLEITPQKIEAALKLLSKPIEAARAEAAKTNRGTAALPTAYKPSLLRLWPVISWDAGKRLRAPLPELINLRTTAGVFYDLIPGGSHLRNEASDRFESYCANYIATMMPRFSVSRSVAYSFEGSKNTPDILISEHGQVVVVIECKATRLALGGRFSEDPVAAAETAFTEIAKGVAQIWRYFSHARRGAFGHNGINPAAQGMVLTLDPWLVLSRELQTEVLKAATMMVQQEPDITDNDRRNVVFCTIDDLEGLLANANEDEFLRAMLVVAKEHHFLGWTLPDIHRESQVRTGATKPFPFEVGDVLPWWTAM